MAKRGEVPQQSENQPFSILTDRPVDGALGASIWLISGRGSPATYHVHYVFVAEEWETAEDEGFKHRLRGTDGVCFDPPVCLDNLPWFPEFAKSQGNFAFGLSEITRQYFIDGLQEIASTPPTIPDETTLLAANSSMNRDWTRSELQAATRSYLWMMRSQNDGFPVNKASVRKALVAGPLSNRNDSNIEFCFQNLSAVMEGLGRERVSGYRPAKNVRPNIKPLIMAAIEKYESGGKHSKRVSWLVNAIPEETVKRAASELGTGKEFDYDDSTTYDVVLDGGEVIAPKAVIGYSALLHYGAPLLAVDFVGGEGTPGFERIRAAGLQIGMKVQPDSQEFRKVVKKAKAQKFTAPPMGRKNPPKNRTTTTTFSRLPEVVAYVEQRANGDCERCGLPAPFQRPEGDPYLEVHHIDPLAEGGADTVENAAGLCPNCHRRCHSGADAMEIRKVLKEIIHFKQAAHYFKSSTNTLLSDKQ